MIFLFRTLKLRREPSRAGFSLIEVAIVLGVIALVLGALWVGVGSVLLNYNIYKAQNQIRDLVLNVREGYAATGRANTWANGQDVTAILLGGTQPAFPSDMRGGASALHALGGTVVTTAQTNPLRLRVRMNGLRQEACVQFLVKTPVLVKEAGITRVEANGGNRDIDLTDINTTPVSLTQATAWCNQAGTGNYVQIDFRLRM